MSKAPASRPTLLASLVVAFAAATVAACATSTTSQEQVGSSSAPIQNGTIDSTHTYAVGIMRSQGRATYSCSGTLIAPNLVLTARHCVAELDQKSSKGVDCKTDYFGATVSASTVSVTTSTTFSDANTAKTWYQASQLLVPSGTAACGTDVALIILSKSIPSTVATPVAPAIDHFLTEYKIYSSYYTAIGYGLTAPDTDTSGTRHIVQNMHIACLRGLSVLDCWANTTTAPSGSGFLETEFIGADGVCSGDSGGGAYEQVSFSAGTPKVVGVAARAGSSNGQCVGSIYERVDHQRDFLISGATQAATLGGYSVPAWTLAPPPSDAGPPSSVPDAEPQAPDGGATAAPKGEIGDPCVDNDDCNSALCAAESAGKPFLCTMDCADDSVCPSGFSCRSGICLAAIEAAPVTTTNTTGCSMADPSKPVPWRGTTCLLVGLALFARARAKRTLV